MLNHRLISEQKGSLWQGPMNSPTTSVSLSLRNALFLELTHYFFLILCMKLGDHHCSKVKEHFLLFLPKKGAKDA